MKITLALSIIFLFIQTSFGQACGVYELKYQGSIKSTSGKEFKIKLPTTYYFHTEDVKESSKSIFNESKLKGAEINFIMRSHLTSVYTPDQLIELYKNNRDFIPVWIKTIEENGEEKIQFKKIPIANLKFKGIKEPNGLTEITIDLGEIKI
ncbi:hypothetical protein [Aureivirga sp. CE67]|uniref:hypothetical protein n=1 Tax=Aureivirga sp. CE67 TaxID=1788983 RepID=UPI0018C97322|nr:hypothetical protein [Aureivirga sp. CE67]